MDSFSSQALSNFKEKCQAVKLYFPIFTYCNEKILQFKKEKKLEDCSGIILYHIDMNDLMI